MIKFESIEDSLPFQKLYNYFLDAKKNKQENIDALSISSFNSSKREVSSRFVNLKYIKKGNFYFFSNYHSPKSVDFKSHNQVSAIIFWNKINVQIRIKANIQFASDDESNLHFLKRTYAKNILSICSDQSSPVSSFENFKLKYENSLKKNIDDRRLTRPDFWGGFEMTPYYFEFWEGGENRLNKRTSFTKKMGNWSNPVFLQP